MRSRPIANAPPVIPPSACRVRWFHRFSLRSHHHSWGRGYSISRFGNTLLLRPFFTGTVHLVRTDGPL